MLPYHLDALFEAREHKSVRTTMTFVHCYLLEALFLEIPFWSLDVATAGDAIDAASHWFFFCFSIVCILDV
jgi:hypothetical protein